MPKRPAPRARKAPLTARTADPYDLYQRSVQNVEHEVDFVDRVFLRLRGRRARSLREDFCGTGNTACEWVRRRRANVAVGLDLDPRPLAWGRAHNVARLTPDQQARVALVRGNVLSPPPLRGLVASSLRGSPPLPRSVAASIRRFDLILAMNFSYWTFRTRALMLEYFTAARRALSRDGLFILDFFGGSDVLREMTESTRYGGQRTGFTYIWDQARYDPITGDYRCHIHFRFPDGSRLRRAFSYHWRLWTLPELRDILADAGFRRAAVYTEGDDGKGGGNGVFREARHSPADRTIIAYIVAVP
jgi:SAM-dependent methyltransferase